MISMEMPENYTEIDLSHKVTYHPNFMVLFDPDFDLVVALSKKTSEIYIFIFLTTTVDEATVIDWTELPKSLYIIQPIFIGNYPKQEMTKIVNQIIEKSFNI